MAAKLQETATVHQLKPRKAKGAGGQKRKGPSTGRLKPRPGESKPAIPAQPSDADIRREKQDRLIALHLQHRTLENREAVAGEAISEIRGDRKLVRTAIQNAGFPLEIYDDANKKLKLKTKKIDLEQQEKIRALIFEAFGLPVGPQPELALKDVPEAAKPGLHWESAGYFASISGEFADPERDGVPPENLQDYMRGFHSGTARNASGIKALKAETPASDAPPLMVGEDPQKAAAKQARKDAEAAVAEGEQPTWEGFPDDPDLWTAGQIDVFTGWFDALDPADEVDLTHPGAIAMFDRLADAGEEPAPEAFEATPAELAAQAGRAVNHEPAEFED